MTSKRFAAILGFAFVVTWIAFGAGNAILCLLGSGAFYLAAGVREGEIDLGDLQSHITQTASAAGPLRSRTSAPPASAARPRVQ